MNTQCDIAIIGGGPVGLALALALRDSGLRVTLLEARKLQNAVADPRALALSYGSRLLLDRLAIWERIPLVSNIRTIHISQRDSFGRTILRAGELNVPELGYVLPYEALHRTLLDTLLSSGAGFLSGAVVNELKSGDNNSMIHYTLDGLECSLTARLAVVADGGKLLEHTCPPILTDYGQSAVIAHLTCAHPMPDTAFERFTALGPVALLPYRDGYELVWTAPHERAQEILNWDETEFLNRLHLHFGDRVGRFTSVGVRSSFPLRLKRAPKITQPHTVLIGNAAQTLHPVAGQGFNMGLRDAWELAQVVLCHAPELLGSAMMLSIYEKSRLLDRTGGMRFTDGLVRLFSNDLPLVRSSRASALSLLDCLPVAKNFLARRMMFGANG